jgi:ectoine hydroxylase-related dioxygenase (phytanoyl-CoA dioxygenase family)
MRDIEENGFAIAEDVFTNEDILKLLDDLAAAMLRRSRAGVRHALQYPAIAAIARDPRLLNFAKRVLGSRAVPFHATLFDKSTGSNWLVAWHQDTALPLRKKLYKQGWGGWSEKDGVEYAHAPASVLAQVLALRLHLDDSTSENGPLRVLPGTHRLGVLNDKEIQELVAKKTAVNCLVQTGGVLAMRPLIVHASSKMQSKNSRRVLHIEYAAADIDLDGLELAIA